MPRDPKDVIQVVSPPDQAVINVIRDCFEARIVSKASISVAPLTNTSIKTLDDLDKIAASLVDLSTKNIRHARIITTHNVRCDFDRGVTRDGQLIPALYEAEFFLNVPQGQQTDENVARQVANAITRHCGTVSNKIQLGSSALSSAIASHVESLASVAARVSEQLADAQIAYDKKLQNHLEHLERKVQEQDKSREKQHQNQLKEIEERKNQLEEKEAELDLRRARDARRKLREDITNNLKERLSWPQPSRGIRGYRYGVIFATIIGITLAVISAIFAINSVSGVSLERLFAAQGNSGAISAWLGYARFFASSALATVLVFYLLSYIKRIEREDTRFERDLERYSLDIDRASWVIETVMEFRDEEGGLPVPEVWLNGATANLFGNPEAEVPDDETALGALGEILRTGARLKVGNGAAELELDGKASKRAAKSN